MMQTIKTLILEFVAGNGPGHIREIHLQVAEFRPEVPQHTVRARLSEMSRSESLEEKLKSFGNGFYGLYEENKEMCSVVSYPNRGPWGDSTYRGNCSGYLVKDLILRFNCQSVLDPAEGGGTVKDVVSGINKYRRREIHYEGRDLKKGWDILNGQLPDRKFDLVWYHPPYWDIIRYSDTYFGTMQTRLMQLMADKFMCSLAIEGELSDKGLAALSETSDSMAKELAKMLVEKSESGNNRTLKDIWADYRKKEVHVEMTISKDIAEPIPEPETISKEETHQPTPEIKMASSEVEKIGDRIVKVQFIEYVGKRKKKVTHIEVKEAELDEMLKKSDKPVQAQFSLF